MTLKMDAFLFLPDCKVCVLHIRYLFIGSEAGPGELRHTADEATLTMTNINIYRTVYYTPIYFGLLKFKHNTLRCDVLHAGVG